MANDSTSIESNSELQKISQVIGSGFNGSWEEKWQRGLTPWDLGKPTPIIEHLHQAGALPNGRTLIPGCGRGYDVVAIACPERFVVGLDISDSAIKKAKEADFFTWNPTELFDLIFDYTFFCAIEPDMRPAWANRMQQLLKPDGELLTLMFPISDHTGGPPYKVSIADYEKVLHPMRFKAVSIADNEMAIGSRKGREKLGRWKRTDEPLLTRSIRESWELAPIDKPNTRPTLLLFLFWFPHP